MKAILGLALVMVFISVLEAKGGKKGCKGAPMDDNYIKGPHPSKNKYKKGDAITYECIDGYHIQGEPHNVTSGTIYCVGPGWSGPRPCCEEIDNCTSIWKKGLASTIADGAESYVYCPVGFYAAECLCEDGSTCDGAYLTPGDITMCTAVNSGYNGVTVAVTRCDPVNGKVVIGTGINLVDQTTIVTCPAGYDMENCIMMDPWDPWRDNYLLKLVQPGGICGCQWKTTTLVVFGSIKWNRVSARCTKKV